MSLAVAAVRVRLPAPTRQVHERGTMRSELVYAAGLKMQNRFLLAVVTMRAVRKLHIISTRTEDTANQVFLELAAGRSLDVTLPEIKPLAPIEPLLITPAA
jgi:hypothetical protein